MYQLLNILRNVENIMKMQNIIVMTKNNWDDVLKFRGINLFKLFNSINFLSETIKVRNGIIVEVDKDSNIPFNIKSKIKK